MIEVNQLTRKLGSVTAVANLSFRVEPGQILGLLGPNGAGKTTTLRVLATYLPPSSGTVRIAGHDVGTSSRAARLTTGYLPEQPPHYREMWVGEFLGFMAEVREIARDQRQRAVERVIESCGLAEVRRRPCG